MKVISVTAARYASTDATSDILCTVQFDAFPNPVPHFRARQTGTGDDNETAVLAALKGVAIAPYVAPALTKTQLVAYATKAWKALLAKGEMFNVAPSGSAALNVLSDGTNETRADLALLALFGQANPTGTKVWIDNTGASTTLTGAECVTLTTLVGDWVADTYPALAVLEAEIASGAVTTTAAIDAYVWPTS